MDNEYEIQKALGTLRPFLCTIVCKTELPVTWERVRTSETTYRDVIFMTYGEGEHLMELAREWLREHHITGNLIRVEIQTEIPTDKLGKFHGPNSAS